MTRIAVLGGRGFLGSRLLGALARAGLEASAASRRAEVTVDVTRPETWEALSPFDVVVDLSDTVSTPPDALIAWCLARRKCVIEATSEAPCVERLFAAHRGTAGRLVLGGGIFTGVSNLLAADVAARAGRLEAVTLGVSSSPFSGAGAGTIALMVRALGLAPVRYEAGQRVEDARLTRGPPLAFGSGRRATARMSLAEPLMLRESTGAPRVDVYFSPRPPALVSAFTAVPAWVARSRWYQAFMHSYFTLLRAVLLRAVPSTVELVALAQGSEGAPRRWVRADDGLLAAGYALAAMTESVTAAPAWSGVRFIDQLCALEPVLARANALAGDELFTVSPVLT